MTRNLIFKSILFCLVAVPFLACKKNVTSPSASLPVSAAAVAGNFTVGSFVSTRDQTSTFNGFTFTFNENGSIVATNGSNTFNGTWSFDDSDSTEFKIHFSDAPLNELNKGWHIAELTRDHLLLTDDSNDGAEDANDDHPSGNSRLELKRH